MALAMSTALGRAPAFVPHSASTRSSPFVSSFVATSAAPFSSARTLSGNSLQLLLSSTCSSFALVPLRKKLGLVVRAKKPSMACTKRSRSRMSRARTQGFRKRMETPGGRNVLRRRRRKGRKVLVTQSFPRTGKRA